MKLDTLGFMMLIAGLVVLFGATLYAVYLLLGPVVLALIGTAFALCLVGAALLIKG